MATISPAATSRGRISPVRTFSPPRLRAADFTDAVVRGANFYKYSGTGLTLTQLYSTASYQAKDLSGIDLGGTNLAGVNFAGQNLTGAALYGPH